MSCRVERRTIKQLIDEHKVVLDGLLVHLAEIAPTYPNESIQEFKDQGGIGVGLGDRGEVEVLVPDVQEGRRAQRDDG